ncbi:DNA alkylation repair protein [Leucobacter triazinivorans]|uniref:DNA alkylation repair protein n=1 Tax=Leucobacter triazinivorans TaxID=1784719 RepID=A0A4P6KH55_9MICO|nr:DNA alkylation repair protein [Leucobacter triazinivorans]QBE49867.1 DNA alkylation repair protein [Leucobacter triazinivorans]
MSMTDELLGSAATETLLEALGDAVPGNPMRATRGAADALDALTLSGRARALAGGILEDVAGDHAALAEVVRSAMPHPGFKGWLLWPVGLSVARRAVHEDSRAAFDDAMSVLRELTPRFTSEFAIRPLLLHDLDRALDHLAEWTREDDWNVRRLASEGSRPLLPWGERIPALVADPAPSRPILDALFDDPSDSVRRSVANHLNDHSRAHTAFALDTVRGWQRRGGEHTPRTARHALRTLVKRGDPEALTLLGFPPAHVTVSPLYVSPDRVEAGGTVRFGATIENPGDGPAALMVDYVLFFPGARGEERTKVFKLARRDVGPGERTSVEAAHSFRPITTRRYFTGAYGIALQVNGVRHERADFTVLA